MASTPHDSKKLPRNPEKEEKDGIEDGELSSASPKQQQTLMPKKKSGRDDWPPFPSKEGPTRKPFGTDSSTQLSFLFKRLAFALQVHQVDQSAFIDQLMKDLNTYTLSISTQIDGEYDTKGWNNHKIMPMAIRKAYRSAICQLGNHKLVAPITLADQHTSCLPCLYSYVERQISFGPWNHFKGLKCPNCPCNSKYTSQDLYPLWELKVNKMLVSLLDHIIPQWEEDIQEDINRVFNEKKRKKMHSEQIYRYMGYYYELKQFKERVKRAEEIAVMGSCVIMMMIGSVHVKMRTFSN